MYGRNCIDVKNLKYMTRLYLTQSLKAQEIVELNKDQRHYLEKVLRFQPGEYFIGFDKHDGEWEIVYEKPYYRCTKQRKLASSTQPCWLAFSPLKHDPMSFLIEKATEIGVTDFQPIITERTNSHRINIERLRKNATEASQQCERLDIPTIHEPMPLNSFLNNLPKNIHWHCCLERSDSGISEIQFPAGFIVGPEGGWSNQERTMLEKNTTSISLGKNILRAETAAIVSLSTIILLKNP